MADFCAEGRAGHGRVVVLARSLDRLLRRCGWVKIWGSTWKPRGAVTMRHISGYNLPTKEAVEREAARRHFARAEDIEREVEKYRLDVVEPHLQALVELLTPNPMRREATRRYLLRTAEEIAGPDASAVLKAIAVGIVLFDCESHFASSRVLASAARAGVPHKGLVHWRASAELRLNAKLRSLGYARDLEESALARDLARLRIAAG